MTAQYATPTSDQKRSSGYAMNAILVLMVDAASSAARLGYRMHITVVSVVFLSSLDLLSSFVFWVRRRKLIML